MVFIMIACSVKDFQNSHLYLPLLEYIGKLNLDINELHFGSIHDIEDECLRSISTPGTLNGHNSSGYEKDDKFISLDLESYEHLKDMGIKSFYLPMPDSCHDTDYMFHILSKCRRFVHGR